MLAAERWYHETTTLSKLDYIKQNLENALQDLENKQALDGKIKKSETKFSWCAMITMLKFYVGIVNSFV